MASGVPVVASAVDGIAEVCSHGIDALLVHPRDLSGYTTALERLISDEMLRKTINAAARRTILSRYEIRSLVAKVERLYEEVLAELVG